MKKVYLIFLFSAGILISMYGCKNKKGESRKDYEPKTQVDSLEKDIDKIHIQGMGKMAQLTKMQNVLRAAIDSIDNRGGSTSKLDSLLKDLEYAEFSMDKWMMDFYDNPDTLSDKPAERLTYLENEKKNAERITNNILDGIRKADSLTKMKN